MDSSIVTTKIYIPQIREDLLLRLDLITRVKKGLSLPLTLISAPAGYGKTTLLVELASSMPLAWYSIDDEDNDPIRFWSYVLRALQTIQPDLGQSTSQILTSTVLSSTHAFLIDLINELSNSKINDQPLFLVLDDYHLIEEKEIHDGISYLLDHIPRQLHLIISTRTDPPFSIAKIRVRGQLNEFRAHDLRFSIKETEKILNDIYKLNLSKENIEAMDVLTEGWIASLQMAAISMQRSQDTAAFIENFTGTHRHVVDYLAEEVLNQQTETVRSFLIETSVLRIFNGPLCDAVTGHQDGTEILEKLDKANMFLIPLDDTRTWYRYHHLFASLLISRLKYQRPERIIDIQKRAADWFSQNDFIDEAIYYALESETYDLAARLISTSSAENYIRSEYRTLMNRLIKLPDEAFIQYPRLAIWYAHIYANKGQIDEADFWLKRIEDINLSDLEKIHYALPMSYVNVARNNDEKAIDFLNEVVSYNDNLSTITSEYDISQIRTLKLAAFIYLSQLYKSRGQLRLAIQTCQYALSFFSDIQLEFPWSSAITWPHSGLAEYFYERNELIDAKRHASISVELADRGNHKGSQMVGYAVYALVNRIKEDGVFIHPEKTPGNIFREMGQSSLENNLCFSIGSLPMLIRKLFAEGDNKGITQLVNNIESIADLNQWRKWALVWPVLTIDLAVAYSRLVEGRLQEADALLSQLKQTAEKNGRKGNLIEILLLQALTLQAQDKIHQATELVIQALQLAEPEGYFRVFVDMGTSMIHLLKEITLQEINLQYVHRLLAEFDRVRINQIFQIDSLVEPLTRREFEILSLLADDLTNLEIAQRLVISIGTVKTHTHNIYAKLGVRNRHQAIKRATELNMV